MTRDIIRYIERALLYAARLQAGKDKLNSRAQMMADCAELHEISARLYQMLYQLRPELIEFQDPHTLRYREYGTEHGTENQTATVESQTAKTEKITEI